jgi:hypothetical protein
MCHTTVPTNSEIEGGCAPRRTGSEPAADVHDARRPAQLAPAPLREAREPLHGLDRGGVVEELRAKVHVQAGDLEPHIASASDRLERLLGREAELRPVMRCLDRRMRVGLHARGRAHEYALDTRFGRELDLVRGVDHHEPRSRAGGGLELFDALVVAVDDQPVAWKAGPCAMVSSPESRRPHPPLAGEELEDGDVRERLHAVRDERFGRRKAIGAGRFEHRVLVVHEERRTELGRELCGAEAGDRQLAVLDGGRFGEELEHRPILPAARW